MNLNNIYIIVSIILAICAIVTYFKGGFRWMIDKLISIIINKNKIPKETVILINPVAHWRMISTGDKQIMQLTLNLHATNKSEFDVQLIYAKMNKPKLNGSIYVVKETDGANVHGKYLIPQGSTTKLSCNFSITPPIKEKGEIFTTDISIVDQFNNDHWVKKVEFHSS